MPESAQKNAKKILPILIGIFFLLAVLVLGVFLMKGPKATVENLMVTNIADTSATVVWTTQEPTKGVVYVSDTNEWGNLATKSKEKFWDTRDIEVTDEGEAILKKDGMGKYYTHHVTVTGLDPETEYFIRTGDGGMGTYELAEGETWPTVKTGPTLEMPIVPNTVYGKVVDEAGNPVTDAVVTIQLQNDMDIADSTIGSNTVADNGTFTLEISNLRTLEKDKAYKDKYIYQEKLEVIAPEGFEKASRVVYPDLDQPVPDIVLMRQSGSTALGAEDKLLSKVFAASCTCSCNGGPGNYTDKYCGKLGDSTEESGGKCYEVETHCNAVAINGGEDCNSNHDYKEKTEVACSGTEPEADGDGSDAGDDGDGGSGDEGEGGGGGDDWAPGVTGADSCAAPSCWSAYTEKCYQSGLRMGCATCNYCCNGSPKSTPCSDGGGAQPSDTPGVTPDEDASASGGDDTNCGAGRTTSISNGCPGDVCGDGDTCGNATCDYCDCGDEKDIVPPGGTCHIEEVDPFTPGSWGPCGPHAEGDYCCSSDGNLWTSNGEGAIKKEDCGEFECQGGACRNPDADFSAIGGGTEFYGSGTYCTDDTHSVWCDSTNGCGEISACPYFCCGDGPGASCEESCVEAPESTVCDPQSAGCDGQIIGGGEYPGTTYTLRCSDNTVKTYTCGSDGNITETSSKRIGTAQEADANDDVVTEEQADQMVGVIEAEPETATCGVKDVIVSECMSGSNEFVLSPQNSGTTTSRTCKDDSGNDIVATWTCALDSSTGVADWTAATIETAPREGCNGGIIGVYTEPTEGVSVTCTITSTSSGSLDGDCWASWDESGVTSKGCDSSDSDVGNASCSGISNAVEAGHTGGTVIMSGCTGSSCTGSQEYGGDEEVTVTCSYPVLNNGESGRVECKDQDDNWVHDVKNADSEVTCVNGEYDPQLSAENKQNLLGKLFSPAKAQGGNESDGFQGPGVYKITLSGYDVTTENVKIVEVDEDGNPRITFFDDTNKNGIRDDGEEELDVSYDLLSITQTEAGEDFRLNIGWNLVGFPLLVKEEGERTAGGLLKSINQQGIYATQIAKYYKGQWVMFTYRSDTEEEYGTNFQLVPGEAYFIRSYQRGGFVLTGNRFDESVPVEFMGGWNLISVISPQKSYTAESVLDSVSSNEILTADTVSEYSDGSYSSVVKNGGVLYGNDFKILEKRGYFVKVQEGQTGKWVP